MSQCPLMVSDKAYTSYVNKQQVMYTMSQKTSHYNIVHNFAKCRPIFKSFSLTDSIVNVQQNCH